VRPSGIVLILPYKVECSRQGKKLAFDFLKRALVGAGVSAVGGMRVLRGPRSRWLRSAPLRRRSSEPPTILSPTSQWAHRSGSRQHVTGSSASSGSTPQRQPPPSASRCVQRARPPAFVAPGYQNVTLTFASHSSTIQITLHETLPSTPAESSATPSFTFAQHLRNSNRSLLQQARMPFAGLITHEGFHEPMRWMSKIPHRDVGNVVAIFRRPLQRLLSARAYLRKHPRHCCGLDWGLWPRRREQARAAASAREFALLPGMRGCQAKMLLGVRM